MATIIDGRKAEIQGQYIMATISDKPLVALKQGESEGNGVSRLDNEGTLVLDFPRRDKHPPSADTYDRTIQQFYSAYVEPSVVKMLPLGDA